jgi:hypothetical protein
VALVKLKHHYKRPPYDAYDISVSRWEFWFEVRSKRIKGYR